MIFPQDILVRDTPSGGQTVWVSQRLLGEVCGINEEYFRKKARVSYKQSLPPSWQKVAQRPDFLLGDNGKSWRWGFKEGQYYYDIDRIPNKRPTCYRDKIPAKEELIRIVEQNDFRSSKGREKEQRHTLSEMVDALVVNSDIDFFHTYTHGHINLFNKKKASQLAKAVAWVKFIRESLKAGKYKELGFPTQDKFFQACTEILSMERLEGLKMTSPGSLRKKVLYEAPEDSEQLREFLISGRYGNSNSRKIGKLIIVDYSTGEVLKVDEHETIIMHYWLNPGGSTKGTKKELYEQYAEDMREIGKEPVSFSTFTHYTNTWINKLLSAKERHGKKHFNDNYRPYVPAKPLEFANSLWASDGSGIVPYRYQDSKGGWRMMKLYVMLVSDVASRYIAGWAVSKQGQHLEDFSMLHKAMRMALLDNGKTEVMDFISDNHGAYTSEESKLYLQMACKSVRNIQPGMSQANPAETIFRLFKRRFKRYFRLPETSWGAKSLESMANPDYYDIMDLPDYTGAIELLEYAIQQWNTTKMTNGLTPSEWFHTLKNPKAGQHSDQAYRRITGYVSNKDLSHSRRIMQMERAGQKYFFEVPGDTDTMVLIARHMGYSPQLKVKVYWDQEGADLYTEDGVYILTCPPARQAAKSMSEATSESVAALNHYATAGKEMEQMADSYVSDIMSAREVLFRSYEFNVQESQTKELYNGMREHISAEDYAKVVKKVKEAEEKENKSTVQQENEEIHKAALALQRAQISDINKYIKAGK